MGFDPVEDLKLALIGVLNHGIGLNQPTKKSSIADYKEQRADYYRTLVKQNLAKLKDASSSMDDATKKMVEDIEKFSIAGDAKSMIGLVAQIAIPKQERTVSQNANTNMKLPFEIRDDVFFDLAEVDRCLKAEAYRSAMILCARVLETALHRKYYDVTGKDLLETSPGIGLGSIISKLKDAQIEIDPALTQQIHLINNVRIFSVHKKSTPFQPSKEQAQATLLFTIDILKKLF